MDLWATIQAFSPGALCVAMYKLCVSSSKEQSLRRRNANEDFSRMLSNFIMQGCTPSPAEVTILKRFIAQKHELNPTEMNSVSSALCVVYTNYMLSPPVDTQHQRQFKYNFKCYAKRISENWIKNKLSLSIFIREWYIVTFLIFALFLFSYALMKMDLDQEIYWRLFISSFVFSALSNVIFLPIFNLLNEKNRQNRSRKDQEVLEHLCE